MANTKCNAEGQLNLNGHVRIIAVQHSFIQRIIIEDLLCAKTFSSYWILIEM